MDSIKTEPDSDGEMYPASHIESHHIDIKEEVKPVLVSFPTLEDRKWCELSASLSFTDQMQ
jgi:hypothetical protein